MREKGKTDYSPTFLTKSQSYERLSQFDRLTLRGRFTEKGEIVNGGLSLFQSPKRSFKSSTLLQKSWKEKRGGHRHMNFLSKSEPNEQHQLPQLEA